MAEKPAKPEKKATPPKDDPRKRQNQWEELGQEDAANQALQRLKALEEEKKKKDPEAGR